MSCMVHSNLMTTGLTEGQNVWQSAEGLPDILSGTSEKKIRDHCCNLIWFL